MNVGYHLDTSDVLQKGQKRKGRGTTLKLHKKLTDNFTKNFRK